MITVTQCFDTLRVASGDAATPCLHDSSLSSLSALRSSLFRQVDRWIEKCCPYDPLRPLRTDDDEPCEEEGGATAHAESERRSATDVAEDSALIDYIDIGISQSLNLREPSVRMILSLVQGVPKTIRTLFARWVRGQMARDNRALSTNWKRGLSKEEQEHLLKTFKSLMRKGDETHNPRRVLAFDDDLLGYVRWSLTNGYSLRAELELLNPRICEGLVSRDKYDKDWIHGLLRFDYVGRIEFDESADPSLWITDYDVRWTAHSELRHRKDAVLTPYGRSRLDEHIRKTRRRRNAKVRFQGKSWSISALSRLPQAVVSDKIIRKRLNAGWTVEEAITTPVQPGGRPRKSTAETSKP